MSNKKFSQLTTEEIKAMSTAEYKAVSPFEKKSCVDCAHIISAVSLYCNNPKAIADRGTTIPGCIKCPHWAPNFDYIDKKYHTKENGYVSLLDAMVGSVLNKKWWQFWK